MSQQIDQPCPHHCGVGIIQIVFQRADFCRNIERMTGAKVYLKLFVRVQKNWRKDSKAIERFGY